jgi:hypothetical protein
VFNNKNELVGIVESKLDSILTVKAAGDLPQNINFAVTADVITGFCYGYTDYTNGFMFEFLTSVSDRLEKLRGSTYLIRGLSEKRGN